MYQTHDSIMADSRRSEDVYGEKMDRCIYNGLVKLIGGVSVGIVFSALLLKRKPWPLILGGGVGAGMALSDCNNEFRSGFPSHPHFNHLQKKLNGERPSNMRKGFMTESHERIPPTGELMANISDHIIAPEKEESCAVCKSGSTSCLCKPKEKGPRSAKSLKSVKIKPFPCVSDKFEKKINEED